MKTRNVLTMVIMVLIGTELLSGGTFSYMKKGVLTSVSGNIVVSYSGGDAVGNVEINTISNLPVIPTTNLPNNPLVIPRLPATDLDTVHAYPNPVRLYAGHTKATFRGLTLDATIHIYTISGDMVITIEKNTTTDEMSWNLANDAGTTVSSGVYIYYVSNGSLSASGKLAVIR
jgi:hypothetical protein